MAVQPYPFLRLTDGTTTVTFADGLGGQTSYPLVRATWAPAVAPLRAAIMGGQWPHADVVEECVINVRGATAAIALDNLQKLAYLLDQAERWEADQNSSPVLMQYAPQGSTSASTATPMQAVVLGRAKGDETRLDLGKRMNDAGMLFEIRDVRVRFWRRGELLLSTESATSAATAAGVRVSATFATSALYPCPTTLILSDIFSTYDLTAPGVLLVAPSTAHVLRIDATSLTGGGVAIVADVANLPVNGSVLRTTDGDLTTGGGALAGLSGRIFDFYATVRSNNADATWQIQLACYSATSGLTYYDQAQPIILTSGYVYPQTIYLGTIAMDRPPVKATLQVRQLSGGASSLDFDSLVVLATDTPASHAIGLETFAPIGTAPTQLQVQDRALTRPAPAVELASAGSDFIGVNYRGNIALTTIGSTAVAVLLLPMGPRWRLPNSAGSAVLTPTFAYTRRPVYLTPQ